MYNPFGRGSRSQRESVWTDNFIDRAQGWCMYRALTACLRTGDLYIALSGRTSPCKVVRGINNFDLNR